MLKLVSLITLSFVLVSCKEPSDTNGFVPIIGLDKNNKSEVKYVPTSVLGQQITPYINEISESVSSTLEIHENSEGMPWDLSRVTVGLGLKAETEVLGYLEAEVYSEIELRFQKNN